MTRQVESERKKKALLYTVMICGGLLLMFFLISWKIMPPPPPPLEQMIEVNLGNNEEGSGEVQPLIKGERGPSKENIVERSVAANTEEPEEVNPDDNAEKDAAPVNKPVKTTVKTKTEKAPTPVMVPVPKPPKPKLVYTGPGKGTGNNPNEDNGYTSQGNKPGGKGDAGDPNGDKDSYGNTPGGATGGRKIIRNVNTVRYYSFTGDLPKATIYAIIRISESGRGTFIGFDKGSTSRDSRYATDIKNHLPNIEFQRPDWGTTVSVQFNFKEN